MLVEGIGSPAQLSPLRAFDLNQPPGGALALPA
jgi:hypothetical protein